MPQNKRTPLLVPFELRNLQVINGIYFFFFFRECLITQSVIKTASETQPAKALRSLKGAVQ